MVTLEKEIAREDQREGGREMSTQQLGLREQKRMKGKRKRGWTNRANKLKNNF